MRCSIKVCCTDPNKKKVGATAHQCNIPSSTPNLLLLSARRLWYLEAYRDPNRFHGSIQNIHSPPRSTKMNTAKVGIVPCSKQKRQLFPQIPSLYFSTEEDKANNISSVKDKQHIIEAVISSVTPSHYLPPTSVLTTPPMDRSSNRADAIYCSHSTTSSLLSHLLIPTTLKVCTMPPLPESHFRGE
jgi:hypothetical protein